MEDEAWTILDTLELSDKDREVVEELLELPHKITVSCSEELCVFYSSMQMHDAVKKLSRFVAKVPETPVLVYSGEKVSAVGLVVPPYVHIVIVVRRTQEDEST